jgi:DNA topoisomerase-3
MDAPAAAAAAAGCLSCEEFLMELCEVKHGRTFVKRGGGGRRGRGRGRGRRGRGRGRGKDVDPRMTFDRF